MRTLAQSARLSPCLSLYPFCPPPHHLSALPFPTRHFHPASCPLDTPAPQCSHSSWDSTITLLGLTQLVKSPTRITQTSAALIDHIYTNNPDVITEVSVPYLSISHHCHISCSRSIRLPKCEPKIYSYISFRSFKHFNKAAFFNDLHWAPFTEVLNCTDPDKALATWYSVYLTTVNRHAPSKRKRVKHPKSPPWLNKDIKETMVERDNLKREKKFPAYKKLRNKVKYLVRKAKKEYFQKLIERDNINIASVWRALNVFTKGHRSTSVDIPKNPTANVFNNHFLSVSESLIEPGTNVYSPQILYMISANRKKN